MPKIYLPPLDEVKEFLTGKVPMQGMFSVLKGLIENSPQEEMKAKAWQKYLKPGDTVASRADIDFPLNPEELLYSGIPDWLAGFKPDEKLNRMAVLQKYMENAPNLGMQLQSPAGRAGVFPEKQLAASSGNPTLQRMVTGTGPRHPDYSHAARGASPNNARSPFGNKKYEENITRGDVDQIGQYTEKQHFTPEDISWYRSNQLPGAPYDTSNPDAYSGPLIRLFEEAQSDRHQKATEDIWKGVSPDIRARIDKLLDDLSQRHDSDDIYNAWESEANPTDYRVGNRTRNVMEDPSFQAAKKLKEEGYQERGYASPDVNQQLEALNKQIEALGQMPDVRTQVFLDPHGRALTRSEPVGEAARVQWQNESDRLHTLRNQLTEAVPDTPFKNRAWVDLEMRKALNAALRSGDKGMALSSAEDQWNFYPGMDARMKRGMMANYGSQVPGGTAEFPEPTGGAIYPNKMRKLGSRYGFEFSPQTTYLQAQPSTTAGWPMRTMTRALGDNPATHTWDNFTEFLNRPEMTDEKRRSRMTDLFSNMEDKFQGGDLDALGLRRYTEDTDDYIPNNNYDNFFSHIDTMSNAKDAQMDLLYKNQDAGIPDETTRSSPEWAEQQERHDLSQEAALKHLAPMFDYYVQKFGQRPADTGIRQKDFRHGLDLSDENLTERAKMAGVNVWKQGGAVDEFDPIGHAMHRIGYGPGGKVSIVEPLVQIIRDFIDHMHEVNRLPPEQVTEDHVAKAQDLAGKLTDQGIDPQGLIDQVMQRAGKGPGMPVTEHAEGGRISAQEGGEQRTALGSIADWVRSRENNPLINIGQHIDPEQNKQEGELLIRAIKSLGSQVYGLDESGKPAFLGGTHPITIGHGISVGGYAPKMIDQLLPLIGGAQNWYEKHTSSPGLSDLVTGEGPGTHTYGQRAEERMAELDKQLNAQMGLGEARTLPEHIAEHAGDILPIPGMAEEGPLAKILGPLGASHPAEWWKFSTLMAPISGGGSYLEQEATGKGKPAAPPSPGSMEPEDIVHSASQRGPGSPEDPTIGLDMQREIGEPAYQDFLNKQQQQRLGIGPQGAGGMAEGGQPEQPPQPEAPTEDSLLNDMLQRRILMRQSAPPLPSSVPMPSLLAGGGEVGVAERLFQLLQKLTGGAERVAQEAPKVVDPMAEHAADIKSRNWTAGIQPPDIFKQAAQQSPEMAEHARDIQNRNWTSIYDETPISFTSTDKADGGSIDWNATRERLHRLQQPTISGKPGPMPPPAEVNEGPDEPEEPEDADAILRRAQKLLIGNNIAELKARAGIDESPFGQSALEKMRMDMLGKEAMQMQGMGRISNKELEWLKAKEQAEADEPAVDAVDPEAEAQTRAILGGMKSFPSGGKVEGNVDVSKPEWTDIRRRLAILQNPLIVGKPPSLIPPLPEKVSSGEAVNRARQQQQLQQWQGQQSIAGPDPAMQDMMHMMGFQPGSLDTKDFLDLLKAKIATGKPLYEPSKDPYAPAVGTEKKGEVTVEPAEESDQAEGGRITMQGGGKIHLVEALLQLLREGPVTGEKLTNLANKLEGAGTEVTTGDIPKDVSLNLMKGLIARQQAAEASPYQTFKLMKGSPTPQPKAFKPDLGEDELSSEDVGLYAGGGKLSLAEHLIGILTDRIPGIEELAEKLKSGFVPAEEIGDRDYHPSVINAVGANIQDAGFDPNKFKYRTVGVQTDHPDYPDSHVHIVAVQGPQKDIALLKKAMPGSEADQGPSTEYHDEGGSVRG